MTSTERLITLVSAVIGTRREELVASVLDKIGAKHVLELGVWRGEFAESILKQCPSVERYYMLDPWRHLDNWNKPANVSEQMFGAIYSEAMNRTDFARERRIVLRGTTTEMIERIPDEALDAAYIDGDHTLRGITIDLACTYPKIRPGGVVLGDDYTRSIWQHADSFEPTLVCPYAAYFAESLGVPLIVLLHNQFAIIKPFEKGRYHRVVDTTGNYGERSLLAQVERRMPKNREQNG